MPLRLDLASRDRDLEKEPLSPSSASFWHHRSITRRYAQRSLMFIAAFLLVYHVFRLSPMALPSAESSTADLVSVAPRDDHYKDSFLPVQEAERVCSTHAFEVFPDRSRHRKVYDLFLIGTELDWLEIRLNELHRQVDYFVVVESSKTFTNHPKPLHFKQNFQRFEKFAHQIIYRQVDLDSSEEKSTWDREAFMRNSLLDAVFPSLVGHQAPNLGDVIMVSDTDEIPRPSTIMLLRNCAFPERTTLRSRFFYYSFQWEHESGDWHHPQATYYQGGSTIKPEDLRMGASDAEIQNSSWHCSSCFKTVAEMANKIGSFSHTEYDQEQFRDPAQIVRRVRNGLDLFDRESEKYVKVDSRVDIPRYLQQNEERFSFMLDRDPLNGNFRDYPSTH